MKAHRIFATAALMLASLGVSTAASAQWNNGGDRHYDRRDDRGHDDRGRGYQDRRHDGDRRYNDRRGDRRYYGNRDGRWQRNHGWRNDRRCWSEWRHHRQVRVCR